MSGAQAAIAGIEADAEVELSAEELRELSDYPGFTGRESAQLLTQPLTARSTPPRQPAAARASALRSITAPRLSLSLTVTLGIVCALAVLMANRETDQLSAHIPELSTHPERSASETKTELEPADGAPAAGAPVRFANPFDANEVFEFAPGTTDDEAREEVAQILVKRAMERQQ